MKIRRQAGAYHGLLRLLQFFYRRAEDPVGVGEDQGDFTFVQITGFVDAGGETGLVGKGQGHPGAGIFTVVIFERGSACRFTDAASAL